MSTKMMQKNTVKELFFNEPSKHWHFDNLKTKSGLSRTRTNAWLKKLQKDGLIKRVKPRGKMPYYQANHSSPGYRNAKRVFAFTKLQESGFLDYISSLEKAETVILFGSFARWDWYTESDIDIFIYGNMNHLQLGQYLSKLHRDVQIFAGKDENDLRKMGPALLRNILKGIILKGTIPMEVFKNAAI
jgi:predicted nucleotidyltransferase